MNYQFAKVSNINAVEGNYTSITLLIPHGLIITNDVEKNDETSSDHRNNIGRCTICRVVIINIDHDWYATTNATARSESSNGTECGNPDGLHVVIVSIIITFFLFDNTPTSDTGRCR